MIIVKIINLINPKIMDYADVFVPARDVCRFGAVYQNAVKHFRDLGLKGRVQLAMAMMPYSLDVVWYTFDKNTRRLLLTPAFKKFCTEDFEPPIEPSSIVPLKGGKMFCRNFRLYFFDAFCINKVRCLWSQKIIKAYASLQEMSDDCDFRLVKAYSVGKRREFVCAEWVVTDNKRNFELYYPVFTDDLEKFHNDKGDFLGPLEFAYEPLEVGDCFVHDCKLWEVALAPDNGLLVRGKAPHLTVLQRS